MRSVKGALDELKFSPEPMAIDPDETHKMPTTPDGRRIGPYEVLRELGHGGMGTVYLAARADEHYRKRVAIKVVKADTDNEEVLRQFRRERQILASLEHPNIARLLDGGATEGGLPYFVMEYVPGQPIDEYCDRQSLAVADRLKLFLAVCSAVQHAHRSLIVHRDIKPSNVIVTPEGVPKLLDFGIAKFLHPELSGEGARTATVLAMTPEYASPEQARGEPITTATDVYSLGVVLYLLLTGHHPYRGKSRSVVEILRAVIEADPARPSTVVGLTEEAPQGAALSALTPETVSGTREGTPERLKRRLRGDLDTILMMALRKEPNRRYPSVEAFAGDIARHLRGHPVTARKATPIYRAGKFLRRHAVGATVFAALTCLVLAFGITMAVQSKRLARERDKAQRVSEFLVDLFKVSDPSEAKGKTVTARELLDGGAGKMMRGELKEDPDVRAALLDTTGRVYEALGLLDKAEPLLREGLAIRRRTLGEHRDVAASLNNLANVLREKGDYAGAEPLYREALAMRRKLLGREHPEVATSLVGLANLLYNKGDYAGAEALYREALAMRRKLLGNEHPDVALSLNDLAVALDDEGDYKGAEALYRETLAMNRKLLGNEHPSVAISLNNLAAVLYERGEYPEAETLHREALAMRRKLLGNEHPDVAESLSNLAGVLQAEGDFPGALALYREALAVNRKLLGNEHPDVAMNLNGLAEIRDAQGDYADAEPLYREALAMRSKLLGKEHPLVADSLTGLGTLLVKRGDARSAEPLLLEALHIRERALPKGHPDLSAARSALGGCLVALGRYQEAEPLLLESYDVLRSKCSERSLVVRTAAQRLVRLYEAWGKPQSAARYRAR
jgi:serine/threonine protein kinase/tetratricopeptide (TPR) repeat protein